MILKNNKKRNKKNKNKCLRVRIKIYKNISISIISLKKIKIIKKEFNISKKLIKNKF